MHKIIFLLSSFFALGVVGGIEHETISLLCGVGLISISLIVAYISGKRGGLL